MPDNAANTDNAVAPTQAAAWPPRSGRFTSYEVTADGDIREWTLRAPPQQTRSSGPPADGLVYRAAEGTGRVSMRDLQYDHGRTPEEAIKKVAANVAHRILELKKEELAVLNEATARMRKAKGQLDKRTRSPRAQP